MVFQLDSGACGKRREERFYEEDSLCAQILSRNEEEKKKGIDQYGLGHRLEAI